LCGPAMATMAQRDHGPAKKTEKTPSTGKIDRLTFAIEPPVLTQEDKKKLQEAYRAAQDAN
jgi:hypothetical protein